MVCARRVPRRASRWARRCCSTRCRAPDQPHGGPPLPTRRAVAVPQPVVAVQVSMNRRSDRNSVVIRRRWSFVVFVGRTIDDMSSNVSHSQDFRSLQGQMRTLLKKQRNRGRGGPEVTWRASYRRAMPIRPVFAQIGATRPCFATNEAPRILFRANFQNDPCSAPRSVGAPQGVESAQVSTMSLQMRNQPSLDAGECRLSVGDLPLMARPATLNRRHMSTK